MLNINYALYYYKTKTGNIKYIRALQHNLNEIFKVYESPFNTSVMNISIFANMALSPIENKLKDLW